MINLTDGMLLYHGSFTSISTIDLSKCKNGKDFGRGFYVTSSYEQAKNFAPLSINKQIKVCFCNTKAIHALEFIRSDLYDIRIK